MFTLPRVGCGRNHLTFLLLFPFSGAGVTDKILSGGGGREGDEGGREILEQTGGGFKCQPEYRESPLALGFIRQTRSELAPNALVFYLKWTGHLADPLKGGSRRRRISREIHLADSSWPSSSPSLLSSLSTHRVFSCFCFRSFFEIAAAADWAR